MEGITLSLLVILLTVLIYMVLKVRKQLNIWTKKRVAHVRFLENLLPPFLGKVPFSDGGRFVYNRFPNEKVVGAYIFTSPFLLVKDPEIIERILVKDFSHFVDHDEEQYNKDTLMNLGLFMVTGNDWRSLRNKITPTFTSGKLKLMFDEMNVCSERLIKRIEDSKNSAVDMMDAFGSYAIDVSASTIFGIDLNNEKMKSEYKSYASRLFKTSKLRLFLLLVFVQFPRLGKFFGVQILDNDTEEYFRQLIYSTFKQRLDGKIHRNDYVQLLLKLKEKGHLETKHKDNDSGDEQLETEDVPHRLELTDDILSAQAFQFLIAGYEPLLNTLNFVLYELSQNENIQNKVRREVRECIEKNGELNYKALKEMVYLEQCIKETLRKYPIITNLQRICTKDYAISENLSIEKGTRVFISLLGLQMDPAHYPDPEKFDPDRFHPDSNINQFTYMPFGAGPRVCVGIRFAMMELKLAISKLIDRFNVSLSPKSSRPLEVDPKAFFLIVKNSYFDFQNLKGQ